MTKNRINAVARCAFAFFLLTALPEPVFAQDDEAKALHMAGKNAMEQADKLEGKGQHAEAQRVYAEACLKFKQALALSPKRPTTGMALALCHVAVGKPATALEQFRLAKEWADAQSKADGAAGAASAQVAAASAVEIKKLEAIVPRLRINVPSSIRKAPGLAISQNGVDVPEAEWGNEMVVDPGTITIQVSASGKNTWTARHEASMGKLTDVSVTPDWKSDESPPPPPPPPPPSGRRIAGFVGIGVGGAALVAGSVLGGLALSKHADSKEDGHCDETSACDEIGTALRLDAQKFGNASTAMFVVGGALALTGVILVATAPADAKKSGNGVQAALRMGLGAIEVRGRW
ncbi:MAG: hypothetical protein IPM54_07280 [Polyangiaceae bacterium]|nr:hypothetical protein [Polyangiaceae bacterium]